MYKFRIKKQAKLDYMLPFIPFCIVIVLSLILSAVGKLLGIPENIASGFVTLGFLGATGFVVWYVISPQGEIRIDEQELVIYPLLRKKIKVKLPYSNYSLGEWWIKTNSPKASYVGPVLAVNANGKSVTIGCMDRGFKVSDDISVNGKHYVTCHFVIDSRDFGKLIDYLKSRS